MGLKSTLKTKNRMKNKIITQTKRLFFFFSLIFSFPLASTISYAHCPLCTIGVGAAAAGAVWLGVSKLVVALFIGAFGVSIGWWFGRVINDKIGNKIKFQFGLIVLASFLLTVIPLLPIFSQDYPLYLNLFGEYDTLFHNLYMIDLAIITSILGGIIVMISPYISRKIISLRKGKIVNFQGTIITLILLLIIGGIIQLLIMVRYGGI